jgi:hypothetical protein
MTESLWFCAQKIVFHLGALMRNIDYQIWNAFSFKVMLDELDHADELCEDNTFIACWKDMGLKNLE